METERGQMACSMCCCSGVLEVCGVEFGCSIRCRWATVGVKRTCTTRKWLLWCSWYQKLKPSVNGLVFCDLVPKFVQRLSRCIQTMEVGQGLLFSGIKTFYNVAAARWCQNATLSISCYMIGEEGNFRVIYFLQKMWSSRQLSNVNPCISYNYIVHVLNLAMFCQKSSSKAIWLCSSSYSFLCVLIR